MEIGASFNHNHIKNLGHSPLTALKDFKKLGHSWIRLGAYWDEIEEAEGKFNFKKLDLLVKFCQTNKIKVVLTIGMKAPRYPEYYLPKWLKAKVSLERFSKIEGDDDMLLNPVSKFIENTVRHFKKYSSIKVWQIENEPLDPSPPNWWRISPEFLATEIAVIKNLDIKRKIMINLWGNELGKRRLYRKAIELADIVGFDIYPRHPNPIPFLKWFKRYIGPLDSRKALAQIAQEVRSEGKEVWIAELQTEPWETDGLVSSKENPPSFLPHHFKENLEFVSIMKPSVVLLWGFEYWYLRKTEGDLRYWEEAKKILNA